VTGGSIAGPVSAARPESVTFSGTRVTGPVSVTGATGAVSLVDTRVTGPVTLSGNKGGVRIDGATVTGPVSLTNNTGGEAVVAGNTITGPLSCSGNNPAPVNEDRKNTVRGPASGQCARL